MKRSICILPKLEGLGGPASFYARITNGLQARHIEIHHDPRDPSCAAILIIGGTRHLDQLAQARRRGVRIIQRLDGMNWIHRKRRTGVRHYLRAEINNWILATIRRYLADEIVYQSQFVQKKWNTVYGSVKSGAHLIYNGVDLNTYTPQGAHQRPADHLRLLVVEGRLKGGHEIGLENAIHLAEQMEHSLPQCQGIELMVVADVDASLQKEWNRKTGLHINWGGIVPRECIPEIDQSAHLFFSAEVDAPCPNSVIEALACGLPVISFATGSLPELVQGDAGRLVPYGENYARLGSPDFPALVNAAAEILTDLEHFRHAARARAEAAFNIEAVIDQYLGVLLT